MQDQRVGSDPEQLAREAVEHVREILGCDGAMVAWWDETQRVLVPLARIDPRRDGPDPVLHPGQGLVGEVFSTGRPGVVQSYRAQFAGAMTWTSIASLLAVPLLVDGEPRGVLAGFHYDEQRYGEEAVRAVEGVAAKLAPALTSMSLLAAAQRRAAEAHVLADLMRSAAEAPEAAMRLVCEYAALLLGADVTGLVLRGAIDGQTAWRGVYGNRTDAWRGRIYGADHFGEGTEIVRSPTDPFLTAEDVHTAMAVPLHGHGALLLGWRFTLEPAAAHVELAERLADFATTLVARAETVRERDLVIAHAPIVLAAIDADGRVIVCEGAAASRIGFGENIVGRHLNEALADAPALVAQIQTAPANELTYTTATVRQREFDVHLIPRGSGGYLVATDVTERVRLTREIERRATHDTLTGLPNGARVISLTDVALANLRLVAVIADIRAFDAVNETAGHDTGDELLRFLGRRLELDQGGAVVVGRTGGDEFAVVLPGASIADARMAGEAVRASLAAPVNLGQRTFAVEARCGVAVAEPGGDARALLRAADSALQSARRGAGMLIVHDAEMAAAHRHQLELADDLRGALAGGEIDTYFQPIVDLNTGAVMRLEALARWYHARHGWVPPREFVELAERTGMIGALTEQVLERSLRCAAALSLPVSLNVSGVELGSSPLPGKIAAGLERHGLDPALLGIEITESVNLEQEPGALEVLDRIRALGVSIAIDDFGTGWSSFTLLERLPASVLKLDQTYVGRAATDRASLAIVRSTIEMAHALGLTVVAEGIEDERTRLTLCELGCERGQGFHFSTPRPFAELAHLRR
jgi:diguanylate cyclase (GGDEF)-like protein